MPNYTEKLNLEKPLKEEQYNVNVFNTNSDKIDTFATNTDINIGNINTSINSINSNITGLQNNVNNKIDLDYSNADYQPVNKSGDTMTGMLSIETAEADQALTIVNTNDNTTSAPSENQVRAFRVFNNDDTMLGDVRFIHFTDGSTRAQLLTRNYITGSAVSGFFTVNVSASGVASCSFPNTTCVDGQYINEHIQLATNVAAPTSTDLVYDLSNFLPNDGYIYDVLFIGIGSTANIGNASQQIVIKTSISDAYLWQMVTRTNASAASGGSVSLPVGIDRKVSVLARSFNTGTFSLQAKYYRRVGTNT